MKINALYIHGFMGTPNGGTYTALKNYFKDWNLISVPFEDLHTDVAKTQDKISVLCKENDINLLVGASLGAFYVLQQKGDFYKLVINPCMEPSKIIPTLKDRKTNIPYSIDEKVIDAWKKMEEYSDIPDMNSEKYFGIFSYDDELFHYRKKFNGLFGNDINTVMVDGKHSIDEKFLINGLCSADMYFFKS